MFNYAGTSRAGAGSTTATPPASGSIRQTNQQPSKPSMRRDLSNRSSKSIVGGGGSLWRVQWKMKARVLEPAQPEGFALIGCYLALSWMLHLMP